MKGNQTERVQAETPALQGVGVLVTRPQPQALAMAERLRQLGATPVVFPVLAILPPGDPIALAHTLARLADYHLAIFISPTAVEQGLAAIPAWPPGLPVAGVGQGSAAALRRAGIPQVLAPDAGADSEHLLALPELADMANQNVLILRGEEGRELLAQALRQRGARVDYAACYRRGLPQANPAPLLEIWRQGGIRAVTLFSSESLDNLFQLLGEEGADLLRATPLFAPHPRIAEHGRSLGLVEAIATAPGEAGVLAGLVEYFGHV